MTDAAQNGVETPANLETELKSQLRWLCSIFGQPSDLLRLLAVAEWRRLRTWVRGLEALAAQLVRALAAATPATAGDATSRRPPPVAPAERIAPDTDYPDSARWTGVRLRLLRDPPATVASAAAPRFPLGPAIPAPLREQPDIARGFRSARRLALRLEAVIRVAEDPARYARRRTRRLARRAARPWPRASRRIASPTPCAPRTTTLGPPLRPPIVETG